MAIRRTVYLLALLGGTVFYWAYREWLSWFILLSLLVLPWVCLLISLPAMLTTRAHLKLPTVLTLGEEATAEWQGSCPLPLPALRGKLRLVDRRTGQRISLYNGDYLPTDHCGVYEISTLHPRVCDYLGLFRLPIRGDAPVQVLVRPIPVACKAPDVTRAQSNAWRPKAGGGFSENHELRLYRPGDSLRQVHWKLSAKTGKLVVREPMEALRNQVLLTAVLRGTPEQLDGLLGRLLWLSSYLLQSELPHTVRVLTGRDLLSFPIASPEDAVAAVDALLAEPCAPQAATGDFGSASWRFDVGGDGGEG